MSIKILNICKVTTPLGTVTWKLDAHEVTQRLSVPENHVLTSPMVEEKVMNINHQDEVVADSSLPVEGKIRVVYHRRIRKEETIPLWHLNSNKRQPLFYFTLLFSGFLIHYHLVHRLR